MKKEFRKYNRDGSRERNTQRDVLPKPRIDNSNTVRIVCQNSILDKQNAMHRLAVRQSNEPSLDCQPISIADIVCDFPIDTDSQWEIAIQQNWMDIQTTLDNPNDRVID